MKRQRGHQMMQGVVLIGFSLWMVYLVLSGGIVYYIAPKMQGYVYAAMGVFFLLGVMQVWRGTAEEKKTCGCSSGCDHNHEEDMKGWRGLWYGVFLIPVLVGFTFPDQALNSDVADNRGVVLGNGKIAKSVVEDEDGNVRSTARGDEEIVYVDDEDEGEEVIESVYAELRREYVDQDVIYVEEEKYLETLGMVDIYLDEFEGKELVVEGFFYREEGMAADEGLVARFAMTCCTADVGVYGTFFEVEEEWERDTWIRVRGEIKRGEFYGYETAVIVPEEVEEIEEPESPYVYPMN